MNTAPDVFKVLNPPSPFKQAQFRVMRAVSDGWGWTIFVASSLVIFAMYGGLCVKQAAQRLTRGKRADDGRVDEMDWDSGPVFESDAPAPDDVATTGATAVAAPRTRFVRVDRNTARPRVLRSPVTK